MYLKKNFTNKKIFEKQKTFLHIIKANEKKKNLKILIKLLIHCLKNFSRDDCLISVGGGITGDLVVLRPAYLKEAEIY